MQTMLQKVQANKQQADISAWGDVEGDDPLDTWVPGHETV